MLCRAYGAQFLSYTFPIGGRRVEVRKGVTKNQEVHTVGNNSDLGCLRVYQVRRGCASKASGHDSCAVLHKLALYSRLERGHEVALHVEPAQNFGACQP